MRRQCLESKERQISINNEKPVKINNFEENEEMKTLRTIGTQNQNGCESEFEVHCVDNNLMEETFKTTKSDINHKKDNKSNPLYKSIQLNQSPSH